MKVLTRQDHLRLKSFKVNFGNKSSIEALDNAINYEQAASTPGFQSNEYLKAQAKTWFEYAELLEANGE